MKRTKIVCTLGPASSDRKTLEALALAGMDVARLNFSHGSYEWHAERFAVLQEVQTAIARPVAVLQDLSGPKLRIGDLPPQGLELRKNDHCRLSTEPYEATPPPRIPVAVPELVAALQPDQPVYLDDGQIELCVVERQGDDVLCRVQFGGLLRSRKGIAAPAARIQIPSLTRKDFEDLAFGLSLGVDWIAVSFVRSAKDLAPVRQAIRSAGSQARIIAKVEKPEALDEIDEILKAADGLMVARGDLGVEIPLYKVPVVQKELIRKAVSAGKPVITATQMLESMTHNPRPTRAEVSDVANAIFDGTSAVMLSGETAMGDNPVGTVQTMSAIAAYTDQHLSYERLLEEAIQEPASNITDAISQSVAKMARDLNVSAILCSTTSGYTARMVARMRPNIPIIAATANRNTFRQLPLIWGVKPLLVPATTNTDEMLQATVRCALEDGLIQHGQTVVMTLGAPVGTPGHTNLIKVQQV